MARGWNQMTLKVPSNPRHLMILQPLRHPPDAALVLTCLTHKKTVEKMLADLLKRKSKSSFIAAYTILLSECCCTWWRTKLQTSAGDAVWLSESLYALQEGIRWQEFCLASKKLLAIYTQGKSEHFTFIHLNAVLFTYHQQAFLQITSRSWH